MAYILESLIRTEGEKEMIVKRGTGEKFQLETNLFIKKMLNQRIKANFIKLN
jgi:hypothetical protein